MAYLPQWRRLPRGRRFQMFFSQFSNKLITAKREILFFWPQYRYLHCGDFFHLILFDVEIRKRKIAQEEGWNRLHGVIEHQALEEQNLFPTIPRQTPRGTGPRSHERCGRSPGSDVDDGYGGGDPRRNARSSSPGTFPSEIPGLRFLATHSAEGIVEAPTSQHGRSRRNRPDLAILYWTSAPE